MILTVALNAALDVTYRLDSGIRAHQAQRVATVDSRAGGKALNTARVLHALRDNVMVTGLLGGTTGDEIATRVPTGLRHAFHRIAAESRRAVVVSDPVGATGLWEPGPLVGEAEWSGFIARYRGLVRLARVVVLSGSLPAGLTGAYGTLVEIARARGVKTIVDCDGPLLRDTVSYGPDVVKPNTDELAEVYPDIGTSSVQGVREAAERMRAKGCGAVIASRGAEGIIAVTADKSYMATPPEVVPGNPTGAGDACNAALARGFVYDTPWPQRLREAVALSAAAVKSPVAGEFRQRDYLQYRHHVHVEEL